MLQFNDDLSVRPELAESFESNSDATEFTFHLRKGVTWHDGKDFDADDVVYSMNRHLGEDSVSRATGLVAAINEWKKIDSYTVRAILGKPNVDLPKVLATFHFRIVQNEAENQSDYFYRATGTGPFIVKEFRPGVRSVSRRNENYWRDGPWVDEVEMSAITDPVARVNALVSGDIQMAATIEPRYQKQVMQAQSVSLCTTPSGAYSGIVMMSDRNPGNNPDFVLAVCRTERAR